ncbi:glucuronyl hydrolase [Fulvitalea axinellae]|uniref:Glucuronyl hydrolase n=1 Tax=Fulvitalea axinellae TaxID=1182444 RepID=A0AAU9DF60_9BACT|nr:glucuronyl hydrolase [Fulvitalea axinellae]
MKKTTGFIAILAILFASCTASKPGQSKEDLVTTAYDAASVQYGNMLDFVAGNEKAMPRTLKKDGSMRWTHPFDWTAGFFPGSLWYLYEQTGEQKWKTAAIAQQAKIEHYKTKYNNHDIGFTMNCSFGNALRLTKDETYKEVLVTSANTLAGRFSETTGCLMSWNPSKSRDFKYPVIVDNMMNLELMFVASVLSGDSKYKDIAVTHAVTTIKNHYRPDGSSFHLVDYDPETGKPRRKITVQGYADESAWARGQAWGLYGYVMCYRFTKDRRFLDQAVKIADFLANHKNMPADGVPYWDFNAPNIPNAHRDVSAGAIMASAFYELSTYAKGGKRFRVFADKTITSLAGKAYTPESGQNSNFILMHAVGHLPGDVEVDVPLNYADYYYLEALKRKSILDEGKKLKDWFAYTSDDLRGV